MDRGGDCPVIVVDARWRGRHGIARFANEIVPRLEWRSMAARTPSSPTSPLDVVAPWRFSLSSSDIVYSPGFNAGATRARQVLTLHDLIHLDEPAERSTAKSAYYDLVVKPVVKRAGVVLTVSRTSQDRIRQWLGETSRVDVVDVGNGCSTVFAELPRTAPPASGSFLYVGNLKPHKNVEVLFGALATRPDYRLTLVTGDRERADALAEQHGVAGRLVVRQGLTDRELASLYQAHDAVVLPSRLEGFGLPALEALAAGRRVGYSATCASVKEIVGDQGVAVQANRIDEWADAMDGLLAAGPSTIADSDRWQDRYRWDGVARRVTEALATLSS